VNLAIDTSASRHSQGVISELLRGRRVPLLVWCPSEEPEMIDKRCFLQWFVLLLSYAAAAFFAGYYGLLQSIWRTDVTYMPAVIGALFVATVLYVGFASWRFDRYRPVQYTD
jgi:hypothetical protein